MMGLMTRNRNQPVVTAYVNGKYMHLITSPQAIPHLYRVPPTQLSFRPTMAEFWGLGFGCSNAALETVVLGTQHSYGPFKENLQ